MIDISSFFRDKSLDLEKLRDFGFSVFAEGVFVKEYPILQKKYLLKVHVTNEGQVDFRVFDSENGEEYLPAHVFNATGSLVGEIHHECEVILCEISQHCFVTGMGFHGGWAFPLDYIDADQISEWANEAMHWMVMNGVMNGVSEKELSPGSDAVRAQVSTMLMRFSEKVS